MTSFKTRQIVKVLEKLGYVQKRQTGSHLIMFNPQNKKILPVPIHNKDVKHGLLRGIIKENGSSEKEFLKLRK